MRTVTLSFPAIVVAIVLAAAPVRAQPLFLNILPAGQDGLVPASTFEAGPHAFDQLAMYRNLIVAAPDLTDADLTTYFKDATIGTPAAPESVVEPRPGVTIARDGFGVPHVRGATRADVFFGAGYATARDRLFVADALRHIGRGRMSEFAGGVLGLDATLGFDRTYYRVAGHSEDELQAQVDALPGRYPEFGAQIQGDSQAFVDGMNAYIAEARTDTSKLPAEYDLFGIPLEDWRLRDIAASAVAFTTVIGFGNGGGGEHRNAVLLQALQARFGERQGRALWEDLRSAEDPEAPVTTTRRFRYPSRRGIDADAVAMLDAGSVVERTPLDGVTMASAPSLLFPQGMSNYLAITGREAEGGHPILVGGPQTGYFAPQALLELSLEGGGVSARGATVPGVPYVVLGHTPRIAFTATAGGSDLADVRVERLCDPPGGEPLSGTLFQGACVPLYRRKDSWMAGTLAVTAEVERTPHGPVIGRATVGGAPVVLALERSTFGREIDSAPAFLLLNNDAIGTPREFRDALQYMTGTLNWLYVDADDVAYFHSGRYPIRADGVDSELPSWGTGEWEWQGILPAAQQPFDVNPRRGYITSWNNKPARLWRAADSNYGYGPVYRSLALDVRLEHAIRQKGRVSVAAAVNAMADAATVDLRGQTVLPEALRLAKGDASLRPVLELLADWAKRGAHRLDRDGDGRYDAEAAIALMDEWYPRLLAAVFDGQLAGLYDLVPLQFDDAPSNSNLGSAYQNGYYGYLKRALRQAAGRRGAGRYQVLRCADGKRAGCAAAVQSSLRAATDALAARFGSADPAAWRADPEADEIRFSLAGLALVAPIPWQNRPTFQQVVQIR
jgi:acyl-homoserine lactone acylase PvdQ